MTQIMTQLVSEEQEKDLMRSFNQEDPLVKKSRWQSVLQMTLVTKVVTKRIQGD